MKIGYEPCFEFAKIALVSDILVLGCGFTGMRVARSFLARGACVTVTTRHPEKLAALGAAGACVLSLDASRPESLRDAVRSGVRVLHSIPSVGEGDQLSDPTPGLLAAVADAAERIVYLSTTGVYGAASLVDEHTAPAPRTPRESLRFNAEHAVLKGPWSSLVLRPAAIYGPGRGVHASMRAGSFRLLSDGSNYVSRIHVDDLAAHAEAALLSKIEGAYPVADEEPCRSRDIAQFCCELLRMPPPPSAESELHETRRADRRVDGTAIRRLLDLELKYPSYRVGIPASIAEEHDARVE